MHIIKGILIVVLLIVGVGAGLTVASRYVPSEKWNGVSLNPSQFQPVIASGLSKVNVKGVAQGVGNIRSRVLGVQTAKPAEGEASPQPKGKSVPKKTFDYARYSYCQDIVKNYEAENKEETSTQE